MNRHLRKTIAASGGLLALVSMSCGSDSMELTGKLVMASAQYIYEMDLQSRRTNVIFGTPPPPLYIFMHVSKIDNRRFLFDVDRPIAKHSDHNLDDLNTTGKLIGRGTEIHIFDRQTGQTKFFHTGSQPTYLYGHNKVAFFDTARGENERGNRLYIADLEDPTFSARQVGTDKGMFPGPVIQISEDVILFGEETDPTARVVNIIQRYNLATGEEQRLPLPDCLPGVWRSETKQLLCFHVPEQRLYLTSLDGEQIEYLTQLNGCAASLYLARYDSVICGIARLVLLPWPGESRDVWIYNFRDKTKTRLSEDVAVGRGSVAWFAD